MSFETISEQHCHGGTQGFYSHESSSVGTPMRVAVYLPPAAANGKVPVLYYLAGLTCTEETATIKAGAQAHAAAHGLALVMPDTSPRGAGIEGEDDDWDFGSGAGFYLNATQAPWSDHYRMYDYITDELKGLIEARFPVDGAASGIFGHSMGGHGALTIALKTPQAYRCVSAFAPICAPMQCPWGEKAFSNYLGADRDSWREHDACELLGRGTHSGTLLVDQGDADQFLAEQLHPHLLREACERAGQALNLRMQPGYDHSYYFIQSFMGDHIAHHAAVLNGGG